MKMRKIWRLETKSGKGVYAHRGDCDRVMDAFYAIDGDWSTDRHPCPHDDVVLREIWNSLTRDYTFANNPWYFGFASLAQYRAWFFTRKSRRILGEAGIVLRLYEVPVEDYRRGMNQAIFMRRCQRLVQERSPDI